MAPGEHVRLSPFQRKSTIRWLLQNQHPDGGFCGRTGKESDACYCFWCAASLEVSWLLFSFRSSVPDQLALDLGCQRSFRRHSIEDISFVMSIQIWRNMQGTRGPSRFVSLLQSHDVPALDAVKFRSVPHLPFVSSAVNIPFGCEFKFTRSVLEF